VGAGLRQSRGPLPPRRVLREQVGPLLDPGWFERFIRVWVLFLSVVADVVAGTVATIRNYRTNP
jgi:hypothetical protein